MACNTRPPGDEESEPVDLLVAFVDELIECSPEPSVRALDYTRLLDEGLRPVPQTPAIPPGIIARERWRHGVDLVLAVREDLGIEAEQAWVARRYEGRPTPEVAADMGRSPAEIRDLCLQWEYAMLAQIAASD